MIQHIKFERIKGFEELFKPKNIEKWDKYRGIYIWTLDQEGGQEKLEYIGQAARSSLMARNLDHIKGYESLHYELSGEHRPHSYHQDWCYGKQNADFICIHGNRDKAEKLRKEMLDYAYKITLYFSTNLTETAKNNPKQILEIEKYLISKYKPFTNKTYKTRDPEITDIKLEGELTNQKIENMIRDEKYSYGVKCNPTTNLICNDENATE